MNKVDCACVLAIEIDDLSAMPRYKLLQYYNKIYLNLSPFDWNFNIIEIFLNLKYWLKLWWNIRFQIFANIFCSLSEDVIFLFSQLFLKFCNLIRNTSVETVCELLMKMENILNFLGKFYKYRMKRKCSIRITYLPLYWPPPY